MSDPIRLDEVGLQLRQIADLERLMSRIVYGSATPRELRALQATAERLPQLKEAVGQVHSAYLQQLMAQIDPLDLVGGLIDIALDEDPPAVLKDGGVIRPGYSGELDYL